MYEGTGLKAGDRIRAIVGWEYNGVPGDVPGLEVLATSLLHPRTDQWIKDDHYHHGVIYLCDKATGCLMPALSGGRKVWLVRPVMYRRVKDVGGTFGPHPAAQRITANVLNRMIRDSPRRA